MSHPWHRCVLGRAELGIPSWISKADAAAMIVDSQINNSERTAYHRAVCLRRPAGTDNKVVDHIIRQVHAEIGTYTIRDLVTEFDLPLRVKDDADLLAELAPLGQPLQPTQPSLAQADSSMVVMRIEHSDPRLIVPRAIKIVCDDCKEPCWLDPKSEISSGVTKRCVPCARWMLIRTRQPSVR